MASPSLTPIVSQISSASGRLALPEKIFSRGSFIWWTGIVGRFSPSGRFFWTGRLRFERLDPVEKVGQTLFQDVDAPVEVERSGGVARDIARGGQRKRDTRLTSHLRGAPHRKMAGHARLTAQNDVVLDGRAAGDADLGADNAMPADGDVVPTCTRLVDFGPLATTCG